MRIQILPEDYLAGVRLNMRPRKTWAIAAIALLATGAVGVGSFRWRAVTGEMGWPELIVAALVAWLVLWLWVFLPRQVRKLYLQQRSLQEPFEAAFDAAGMRFNNARGDATLPWTDVHKWRESKRLFLIYQSDALFHLLPKRCFGSEAEQKDLRELLLAQVGPPNVARKA